jgi:hypothetical protein
MSIKDLFNKKRNELPQTTNQEMLDSVESAENLLEKSEIRETFVPQIDYSKPENFTKFGSARFTTSLLSNEFMISILMTDQKQKLILLQTNLYHMKDTFLITYIQEQMVMQTSTAHLTLA